MRAALIQIGNSRGVRIPKAFVRQVGFSDQVEMEVRGSALVIRAVRQARAGWEDAFAAMAARGDDALLETPNARWDESEWKW